MLIVTHDRYFLDNVTGWILELDRGRGIPYEGNYSAYLEKKAKRMAQEGREDDARQQGDRRASASGSRPRPKARQAKSKARIKAYDELLERPTTARPSDAQIVIPPGERLGDIVIEVEDLSKGYGDRLLIDDLDLQAAARRHRRRHRPERRRQDDAVPHDHRPGEARRRLDPPRRDGASSAMSTRAATRSIRTRPSGRRSPAAPKSSSSASAR